MVNPVRCLCRPGDGIGHGCSRDLSSPYPHSLLPRRLSNTPAQTFGLCFTGGGTNCAVDGDTAWMDGVKIRVADIDAPETHPSRCEREADLGRRATLRFQELLNEGSITLQSVDRDQDQYGRKLRIVMRDGQSLGMQLVNEGLARSWTGPRRPWC